MKTTINILISLFLAICIAVHIYGLFYHPFPESDLSHIAHLTSYSLCLYTLLTRVKYRLLFYGIGSLYPFIYHLNCFYTQWVELHKFHPICFQVVAILPVGAFWVFIQSKKRGLSLKQNRPAL
jgi:hypothetical protein